MKINITNVLNVCLYNWYGMIFSEIASCSKSSKVRRLIWHWVATGIYVDIWLLSYIGLSKFLPPYWLINRKLLTTYLSGCGFPKSKSYHFEFGLCFQSKMSKSNVHNKSDVPKGGYVTNLANIKQCLLPQKPNNTRMISCYLVIFRYIICSLTCVTFDRNS